MLLHFLEGVVVGAAGGVVFTRLYLEAATAPARTCPKCGGTELSRFSGECLECQGVGAPPRKPHNMMESDLPPRLRVGPSGILVIPPARPNPDAECIIP